MNKKIERRTRDTAIRCLKWRSILKTLAFILIFVFILLRFIPINSVNKLRSLVHLICKEVTDHLKLYIILGLSIIFFIIYWWNKIYNLINKLKSIKYIWFSYALPKSENQCDFSPERPLNLEDKDELGMEHLVKCIYESITNYVGDASLILGIDGSLGMGKTSLMNLVKGRLKNAPNFITANFDPWYYGDQRALIRGFISAIDKAIKEKTGIPLANEDNQIKEYSQALEFTVNAGPISMKLPLSIPPIEEVKNRFEERFLELGFKMVIFVDDLDRCDKNEALLVLKLLREAANLKKTFFIIGYDKHRLQETIGMDIEKFVDLEIPLNIEQFKLWEWFWQKAKKCPVLYEQLKDALENEIIRRDFEQIFYQYCNTPRKTKQILNDLLLALPVVKDDVYFPHFAIVTIMRRDIPTLYNYLAQGGYWILQEGVYKSYGEFPTHQLSEKEIGAIVDGLANKDEGLKSLIYRYLDILSADISFVIDVNTGKEKLTMDDLIQRSRQFGERYEKRNILLELSDKKAIWRKRYTESYFIWRPPYFAYTDKQFEVLVDNIKNLSSEQEKALLMEIQRVSDEGKLESFLSVIRRKIEFIFENHLSETFIKGLAQVKNQNDLIGDFVKTILDIIWLYPKEIRLNVLIETIRNAANPGFLSQLYRETDVRSRLSGWFDTEKFKSSVPKEIENQYDRILGREPVCLSEFGIDPMRIGLLEAWGNAEKVAKYLKNLEKKHSDCTRSLVTHIENAATGGHDFFRNVYDKYKNLNQQNDIEGG